MKLRWFVGISVVGCLVFLGMLGGCGDSGKGSHNENINGVDGGVEVSEWHSPEHSYRVEVVLNAHGERARNHVPVMAALSHRGSFIQRDVVVYEVKGEGEEASLVESGAFCQPDGTVLEVAWTAEGETEAGATRHFWVYYSISNEPGLWTWGEQSTDWALFEWVDKDTDGTEDGFRLQGGTYEIQRDIDPNDSTLRGYRRSDGNTFLRLSTEEWTVAEGFSNAYQLEDYSNTYEPHNVEEGAYSSIPSDGDGFSAAAGVVWENRLDPAEHDMFLTYRVFAEWPFMEMVISATMSQRDKEYSFSSADWNGRLLYLSDGYDRMVSDRRGDEALEKVWDTDMRWLVVYDSVSNRGVGWFLTARGVVRTDESEGEFSLYDSYGYAAGDERTGGKTTWRYLWMAAADKDTIVERFDAMQPGVTISDPENRDLNIINPSSEDFFFPEDALQVVVTTPGGASSVEGILTLANEEELTVELTNEDHPLIWTAVAPRVFSEGDPEGTWVFRAQAAEAEQEVSFEFRLPNHPKLYFDASQVEALGDRKDETAYGEIWSEMLRWAESYEEPLEEVGEGLDVRSYADRLLNLGLIQLVDPLQPYSDLLWSYFFSMLRYPNWSDPENPFNNHDLTVGHFLTALAAIYDWHYESLTPDERREVRQHLIYVTDSWVDSSWMRIYRDIDWHHFGSVTNNHYWINHQGVAAAAYVLADEMDSEHRKRWTDHLEENLAIILSVLEPDGTSNEGVAYHSYGQINLFRWMDMRQGAIGENLVQEEGWFEESVFFDLYSILPGGDDNYGGIANFGDCPTRHYQPPRTIQSFLASRLPDVPAKRYAQWMAQNLDWPRYTAMSYLWYDPSIESLAPSTLPNWRLFPQKGIFTWRSSWENDATYFSLKCGSYFGGHEQPDAGHFILHRAGVPYVVDLGYSYLKMTHEHNLVLADSVGQQGEGSQWMSSVDPSFWAHVTGSLATSDFFHVMADPTPMMLSENLQNWKREVVGVGGDLFVVRDTLEATATTTFDWLLHSYVSEAPTSETRTYSYLDHRTENPFEQVSADRWDIVPQTDASPLHIADVSLDVGSWTASVEPTMFVPEQNPDTHEYNSASETFEMGRRLRRTTEGAGATSLMVLWFGDEKNVENLSSTEAEGFRVYDGTGDIIIVCWPSGAQVSGYHGVEATAKMAGRHFRFPAYFGQAMTYLEVDSTTLAQVSAPIDLFARLEHSFSSSNPGYIAVVASGETELTLYCPQEPTQVSQDGVPVSFTWSGQQLTLTAPAGESRFQMW